jgi:hypothetical protein
VAGRPPEPLPLGFPYRFSLLKYVAMRGSGLRTPGSIFPLADALWWFKGQGNVK